MKTNITIKLISPKMNLRPMDSEFKRVMSPSLSLVTIACLTPDRHKVYIEDENVAKLNLKDSPDIVGINVNVDTSLRAVEIAKFYRQRNIKVVFGGIHASANPNELIKYCDSIVIGEAEEVWEMLINDFINNNLQQFYSKTLNDLGKIPIANWSFVNKSNYLYNNIISTSRGCPFKCNFCYNSNKYTNNSFRNRPIDDVLQEIQKLETKQIMFIDDNFIGNPDWTREFIQKIKPLRLSWHAAVSANIYHHRDLIDSFAESGCKTLFIGFESINHASIKSAQKSQNKVQDYENLIEILHKKGIMVNASLVFGFDHDEPDVFKNTLNWLVKNKIETMTAHILTPYPGTKLYEQFLNENRIIDFNLKKYNTSNVVFQPKNMSAEELRKGYLWMYEQFYSFKNIWRRKPECSRNKIAYFLFNFCYRKFGKIISLLGKFGLMNFLGRLGRKLSYSID